MLRLCTECTQLHPAHPAMLKYELDQSLISRFYRNRDFSALEEFIRRHRSWALRHAARYSREAAEDIVQTSILRLISTIPTSLPIAKPIGWWRTIIAAAAIDYLRSEEQRKHREIRTVEQHDVESPDENTIEENVSQIQQLELIRSEIKCMNSDLRRPIAMHYIEGLSYAEIAKLLGIRLGTVSSRIHRGIRKIHYQFEKRGYATAQGIKPRVAISEEKQTMNSENQAIVKENQLFAKKWDSLWFAAGRSLGRVTSTIDTNGHVTVHWREDDPDTVPVHDKEFPAKAPQRSWSETEILLTDVQSFSWTRLTTRFCSTEKSPQGRRENECEFTRTSDSEVNVISSRRGEYALNTPGDGPLIMNPQLPLVLLDANRSVDKPSSLRLLGCYMEDQGSPESLTWLTLPVNVTYRGKRGEPMKKGHIFEFANLQGEVGQEVSIWENADKEIAGAFWPEEGMLFTKSEAMARAMVVVASQ